MTDSLAESIREQIVHEKFNANLYLSIAGYLKNKGLDNLALKFLQQHTEETEHSLILFNLLTDLNTDVIIGEIPEVSLQINNIMDIANAYLQREILTTTSLNEIKNQAIEDNNPVVEECIREMIKIQQHEYEESTTFMDKAEMTASDWKFVMLWDLGVS